MKECCEKWRSSVAHNFIGETLGFNKISFEKLEQWQTDIINLRVKNH